MSVVINGNGTVTGVTTLPDGIVTNDDLAGSIADSKIAGLSASKLSGVVPTANLGTGTASATTFLNGSGAYSEAGGGQKTLLQTQTVSTAVASIDFTSYINSTYMRYEITWTRARLSAAGNWMMQVSIDGGSSWIDGGTSSYAFYANRSNSAGENHSYTSLGNDFILDSNTRIGTGDHFNGTLTIYSPSTADLTGFTFVNMNTDVSASGGTNKHYEQFIGGGLYAGTSALNGIRFRSVPGGGNHTQGTFKLYGY